MDRFIFKSLAFLCCIFYATVSVADAQELEAVNDTLRTGPLRLVKKNIIHNDNIPDDNYDWQIINSSLPVITLGTFEKQGENLTFTPNVKCRDTAFTIEYELMGNGMESTAKIRIIVSKYNSPVNAIDPDVECYMDMPIVQTFAVDKKFSTGSSKDQEGDFIDGITSPLVGDLNGDGKPEIVILGITNNLNTSAAYGNIEGKYIHIYNGQKNERKIKFDLTTLGVGYGEFKMGLEYHRAPSLLAIANLDNDKTSEIVVCETNGNIYALRPVFNGENITTMIKIWDGHDADNTRVNVRAPKQNIDHYGATYKGDFGYPMPYIADLNGDNIPEVIVYNKIFNGATGALLMSWQSNAPFEVSSSLISTNGLEHSVFENPAKQDNASIIRSYAMTGRRPGNNYQSDYSLAVPVIVDIDGDGQQEIITGNRIHKFIFNDLEDHTKNYYTTIEGPLSATLITDPNNNKNNTTFYLSDGFTRVADIDGDGQLDIIVTSVTNSGFISGNVNILIYVWNYNPETSAVSLKAANTFYSNGYFGTFSIPFVGDINGKKDGYDGSGWNRKLPEICILTGAIYIDCQHNSANTERARTGLRFHPKSDSKLRQGTLNNSNIADGWDNNQSTNSNRRFNTDISLWGGHIIGLTWDAAATGLENKLKISWGMEHEDISNSTGITLFDFDNNNTADLCYRDEKTLRVISPAIGNNGEGCDYVERYENKNTTGTSVMFSTNVFSSTGFEYPSIADVNMDGSADIIVTNRGSHNFGNPPGWIDVYEYKGQKWAPCPPVWNQGMYDPTQIREDLTINAHPISMLTKYVKNGDSIQPYNGSWIQQPIVRDSAEYKPVVRMPDAVITNIKVKVNQTNTTVALDIFNNGTATIAASSPVCFYDGGTSGTGNSLSNSSQIGSASVGLDIFPNEKKQVTFTINGNFTNHLIWASIIVDKDNISILGHDDCDPSNNSLSGADCPHFVYTTKASPDAKLCGTNDKITLTATPADENIQNSPTYQWYYNDALISGATSPTYEATHLGAYKCYVIDDVCRGFSSTLTVTRANVAADVRIDVCPFPERYICLSSLLDSLDNSKIKWEKVSVAAPDIINPEKGIINTANLNSTSKYKYSVSRCKTGSAIAYVYPIKDKFLSKRRDTIVICKDKKHSKYINLTQILGLEFGGEWKYDNSVNPDNMLFSYVKQLTASSDYYGALIFNAHQAWEEITSVGYSLNYKGDENAKKFVFRYSTKTNICVGDINKDITIIVTEKMF
jgi:hypothetical protein